MNIKPVAFVDTSLFAAELLLKYQKHFADDRRRSQYLGSAHHDTECVVLRGPEKPTDENWFENVDHVDYPLMKKWSAANSLMDAIKQAIAESLGLTPVIFGKAMIVSLKPGGFVDWHVDEGAYAAAHLRFHVGINTCSDAWLYSGGAATQIGVGNVVFFNNLVLHSAANFGLLPRVNLIIDIRRP